MPPSELFWPFAQSLRAPMHFEHLQFVFNSEHNLFPSPQRNLLWFSLDTMSAWGHTLQKTTTDYSGEEFFVVVQNAICSSPCRLHLMPYFASDYFILFLIFSPSGLTRQSDGIFMFPGKRILDLASFLFF